MTPESGSTGTRVGVSGDLATRQAALVAALVAGGPVPAGFDADRIAATRAALLRKRAGEAAKLWPLLAASLGTRWIPVFAAHAREPGDPLRDGWDVAVALRAHGELTGGAAVELAEREAAAGRNGGAARRLRRLARFLPWW